MLHDSGILRVYSLQNTAPPGSMPVERLVDMKPPCEYFYGEKTIGYGRQYAAKGVQEQVDLLVQIWQDRRVRIGQFAVIDGEQYRIQNVQHYVDENGLVVTDLTLQRKDGLYDVAGEAETAG